MNQWQECNALSVICIDLKTLCVLFIGSTMVYPQYTPDGDGRERLYQCTWLVLLDFVA